MTNTDQDKRYTDWVKKNWPILVVFVTVIFISLQPLGNQIIWDDAYLISANPNLGDTGKLWDTLSQPFWHNSAFTHTALTGFWRPVTSLLFWSIGSTSTAAWFLHLISVLAAMGTACLAGIAFRKWLPEKISAQAIAIACSAYFLHPVTAETYCMVANVSDHLALIFFFLCSIAALRFYRNPKLFPWLPIVAITAFLSCGSKEFGVWTAVIPLLALAGYRKITGVSPLKYRAMLSLWCFTLLPVTTFLILRHIILNNAEFTQNIEWSAIQFEPFWLGLGVAARQIFYLSPFPTDIAAEPEWFYRTLTSVALGAGALFIVLDLVTKKRHLFSIGVIFFFLGILMPSFLTVVPNSHGVYEFPSRYFHIAVLGVAMAAIPGCDKLLQNSVGKVGILLFAAILATQSYMRISHWEDAITLFSENVRLRPSSEKAIVTLGESYLDAHAFTEAENLINNYRRNYEFITPFYRAYNNSILSQVAFMRDGNFSKALYLAKKAVEDAPSTPLFVLRLVTILETTNHPDLAEDILLRAIESNSFSSPQRKNLQHALDFIQNVN